MRKILAAAVLAVVLAGFPLSLAAAQGNQAEVDELLATTSEVRGLHADPNVKVNFLSTSELEKKMIEDFAEETPEEEILDAQDIMVMLGLIPEGLDLKQLYIDLYTEQIAGFYDPDDGSLYLISEDQSMHAMDRYILAHELTHYLQDENFDLSRPPFDDPEDAEDETDDDASFAATCLVEGDASITAELWMVKNLDAEDMMEMYRRSGDYSTEIYDSSPQYIQDSLMFPYQEGKAFVEYLYDDGGFKAVDEAYGKPPTTTEQIYHPEKYSKGEGAVTVTLPDLAGEFGEGWELSCDNVLGEFDVYELFKPYFSARTCKEAAEGWGGNRYHFYRGGDGGKLLVQEYAWDSEEDAGEFASAYVDYLEERFGGELKEEEGRGAWKTWSTDDYGLALKKDGLETCLVQADAGGPLGQALAALGEEGEAIEKEALETEEAEKEEEKDYSWVVIGGVIGLLILGLAIMVTMLVLYHRSPRPPSGPAGTAGGPYRYPGGASGYGGPGYGSPGYGGPVGPGAAGRPGGPIPPPPPVPPSRPPQTPDQAPPQVPEPPTISE